MIRGKSRRELGITEQMINTYGEVVFQLSNNVQERCGDPIRNLDFDALEAQRAQLGLSDAQIAARIGLRVEQVVGIRNIEERRRIDRRLYDRLLGLGGTRRFRAEQFGAEQTKSEYSEAAMQLRESMRFDAERVQHYVTQGWWNNDTLYGWLAGHAAATPEALAVTGAGASLTYANLKQSADQLSAGLRAHGIQQGDVVAVQLPNIAEFIVTYLAVTSFGGVLQTLHMPYRETDLAFLLEHSQARAVVCLSEVKDFSPASAMLGMRDQLSNLSIVIALGSKVNDAVSFTDLAGHDPMPIPNPPVGGDPMLLLYTSGTTSNPKGVPLSYQNMLSNARMSAREFGFNAEDRILSAAPFSHLYGLFAMHMALFVGATIALLPVFTPRDLAKSVSSDKPTALFMGPPHAAAMLGMGLLDQHDFSSVRLSIFSGSACPPQVLRDYVGKIGGGEACQLWGMTELQAGTYTRPGDATELSATTAGRPSPGTEIAVVDGAGKSVPAGEEGELRVRGCSVFPGYLNNPTANANEFSEGGWFTTGDLAVIDVDGNLTITGRIKDVINRGGVKFNPLDVENVLLRHPKVAEAAIVPMPDPVLGERACLFVTKVGDNAPSLDELCTFLEAQQVVKNRWPERLEIVEAMPLTPTRKIIKARLVELL